MRNLEPTMKLWKLAKLRDKAAVEYGHHLSTSGEHSSIVNESHRRLMELCQLERAYNTAHMEIEACVMNIDDAIARDKRKIAEI